MAPPKLSANQLRRIGEIQEFQKTVAHLKALVGELDNNRAARPQVLQNLSSSIAREFSHLRQRSLSANVGTLSDVAGQLSIVASRSAGLQMKIRALNDGVASLTIQLDQALKSAMQPEEEKKGGGPAGKPTAS